LITLFSIWFLDIAIAIATSAILLWIFLFYYRRVHEMRTVFTIGLSVFSFIFLLQNLLSIPIYYELARGYGNDIALPFLALESLELLGFVALSWVVRQ
jgi:low affinity Fe/Cu permease